MKITYRLANLEDVDQLVRLRVAMQSEVNQLLIERLPSDYRESVTSYFRKALADHSYFSSVALIDGEIVGTAGVSFYRKPPSVKGGTGLVGYVTNVYTSPLFRGKGIARQLMKKLNETAEKLKADKLHLGATPDGLNVYKAVGYVEPRFVNLEIQYPFGVES